MNKDDILKADGIKLILDSFEKYNGNHADTMNDPLIGTILFASRTLVGDWSCKGSALFLIGVALAHESYMAKEEVDAIALLDALHTRTVHDCFEEPLHKDIMLHMLHWSPKMDSVIIAHARTLIAGVDAEKEEEYNKGLEDGEHSTYANRIMAQLFEGRPGAADAWAGFLDRAWASPNVFEDERFVPQVSELQMILPYAGYPCIMRLVQASVDRLNRR